MNTFKTVILVVFALSGVGGSLAGTGGGTPVPVEPEGIFSITPVLDQSCIAVKVSLNAVQALAGVRWYNNDDQGKRKTLQI